MAGPVAAAPTLSLLAALLRRLDERGIVYCGWKGSAGLEHALEGRSDLDLLVDRADAGRFTTAVSELGFRPVLTDPSRSMPGITDFLGHDRASGRMVHLHVYHRLMVGRGPQRYHLPLESALLRETELDRGVRVPAAAGQVAIAALRAVFDGDDDGGRPERRGSGTAEAAEAADRLRGMRARTDAAEVRAVLRGELPDAAAEAVVAFLEALDGDGLEPVALGRLQARAQSAVAPERSSGAGSRRARVASRLERVPRVGRFARRLGAQRRRRKSPVTGGFRVAFVGPDGAGKSKVISELREWLAWRLDVATLYLGSSQPSRAGRSIRGLVRGARAARAVVRRTGGGGTIGQAVASLVDLLDAVRALAEARDRERRTRRGQELAADGWIVLFDRHPLPTIRLHGRAMDGPRIPTTRQGRVGGILRRLAAVEDRIYRRIPSPDLVIILRVSPAVAVARKTVRDAGAVAAKAGALAAIGDAEHDGATIGLPGARLHVVDADRPVDEVLASVRAIVWSCL